MKDPIKIRHLALLDGCTCAFEEWVNGGRKVHNLMRWVKCFFYEGHFRCNITVPVISLRIILFSKTIPHFVRLYISYKIVKSKQKMRVELEDTRLYIR